MDSRVFVALLFIVWGVNVAAVLLMGVAFAIVCWRRSWTAAMRLMPDGQRPLANRLMACGAALGVLTGLLYLLLFTLA